MQNILIEYKSCRKTENLKQSLKKIKKCLTNEQRFDKIIKLSQESKTKNIDN